MINFDARRAYNEPAPLGMGAGRFAVNSRYFILDGQPCLPVMGEFHFPRYPKSDWKKELEKMRAGGVDIVATYVFWIHHEETRGEWDFSGDRDLGAFIRVCRDINMPLVLRVGPFAHGECRNGGLPDWLVHDKSIHARTNDPEYLKHARELYMKIGEQARGQLIGEGGPIIGVQLENEYGHVGGPRENAEGVAHMRKLKQFALEAGLDVPFFTATGWGGAHIIEGETLPVQGGYVDAPWNQDTLKTQPSRLFLFEPFLDDGGTGADWKKDASGEQFNFDPDKYPFLTAELGGGLQVTHHRRTYPDANDIEALVLCRLGSGANLIGYYMYHGGVNPDGKTTLQESRATGFTNDLPIKSYDFFAPLRESGEASPSYGRIKKLHIFLSDFGGRMAPTVCVLPDERPTSAADLDTPRVGIRQDLRSESEGAGFVFINNHQRGAHMPEKCGVNIRIELPGETLELPAINVKADSCMLLPYNFEMDSALLKTTNAQPLCRLGKRWIFCCDEEPIYNFARGEAYIDTLTVEEANNSYKLNGELLISSAVLYADGEKICAETTDNVLNITRWCATGDPEYIEMRTPKAKYGCEFKQLGGLHKAENHATKYDGDYVEYAIELSGAPEGIADALLELDFGGDRAELYADDRLVADWFNVGQNWRTALRRIGYPTQLRLRVYAPTEEFYSDLEIDRTPALKSAKVFPVYRFVM